MNKKLKEYLTLVFITITLLLSTTILKNNRSSICILIIAMSLFILSLYKNKKYIISVMYDVIKETKAITWSTRKSTIQTSSLVICIVISLCIVFWFIDSLTLFLLKNFY